MFKKVGNANTDIYTHAHTHNFPNENLLNFMKRVY